MAKIPGVTAPGVVDMPKENGEEVKAKAKAGGGEYRLITVHIQVSRSKVKAGGGEYRMITAHIHVSRSKVMLVSNTLCTR